MMFYLMYLYVYLEYTTVVCNNVLCYIVLIHNV